jgi:putative MATE family efflux protein
MAQPVQAKGADLAHGNVRKLLFSLALPTITSQIVNMLYNLVDRVYIGHIQPADTIGALALTGVGVCFPIILLISAFAALMGMGGAPRASIQEGRGDVAGAEQIMGNCLTMLVVTSLVLTAVFQLFAEPLLLTFGGSENTISYALDYMRIYTMGTLFVQVTLGMNAFITAQGFTSVSMKTVLIGALLNTILDPVFIFLLDMGVRGAALATVLSQAISALWVMRFLTGNKTKWHLRREYLKVRKDIVLPCLALGLSPFIMQSTESLIAVCFNSSLLKYGGDMAVGAMTVLTSIMQFALMPAQGLSQGAQPIISFNYGAGNAQRVRDAFRILVISCAAYSMFLWVLVQLFPQMFVSIFSSDPALVDYAAWALRIYMGATGIFGIQIACQQTFIALGNAKTSLFLAVLRKIILLIPLIYILPFFFADKAFAVFLAEAIADLLAVCTTATLFRQQFRRSMAELEHSST